MFSNRYTGTVLTGLTSDFNRIILKIGYSLKKIHIKILMSTFAECEKDGNTFLKWLFGSNLAI